MYALAAFLMTCCGSLDQPRVAETLEGTLKFDPRLEGGVWMIRHEGKTYDLHRMPQGFREGVQVEITGQSLREVCCIHMVGIVFEVRTIRKRR